MGLLKNNVLAAICKSAIMSVCMVTLFANAQSSSPIEVNWNHPIMIVKSTPTLQVVVSPTLRRGSKIHDQAYAALQQLQCDYVRYVPWHPYPRLAVAELKPPTANKTSWNFRLIDPMTEDFMSATAGHSVILNLALDEIV